MDANIFEQIEKMTDAEKKALLETQFPEELEKEASTELDATLLADALYNYGWLQAQRAMAEENGLDKVAAEDLAAHEQAEKEVGEQIEACLNSLGTHLTDDTSELHKEAQVAAALIFDGFSDCIETATLDKEAAVKIASIKGMALKHLAKGRKAAVGAGKAAMRGMKRGYGKAKGLVMKHRGKAGLGAGLLAGAAAHKAMSKSSSALSAEELVDLASDVALEKQAMIDLVVDGIDKLAAKGEKKGKKLMEAHKASSKSSKSSASSKSSGSC
jgi:hypothetical protein